MNDTNPATHVSSFQEENENLRAEIVLLKKENEWLREVNLSMRRKKFGKKSEIWHCPEQGKLFNEAEILATKPLDRSSEDPESNEKQTITYTRKKPKRGKRGPLPKNLERKIVRVELPLEQQIDAEGNALKIIGWAMSEKLEYQPAKLTVIEYHRAKYGVDTGDYTKTAPPVPSIIPKGIVTPSLLSGIVVGKYADGLPLYRMEQIFARCNVHVDRASMARWIIAGSKACNGIWNILDDHWRASDYGSCDETTLQVLKEPGRKAETKSWMIIRTTPYGDGKVALFNYSTSRSSKSINALIDGFKGYLQVDGLSVYDQYDKHPDIVRIGCAMHSRRKFYDAIAADAKAGKTFGEQGVIFFKRLYKIEEEIRDVSLAERFMTRVTEAAPIWNEITAWVNENQGKVPVKSKIGEAFGYYIKEREFLMNYLLDGRLEIDNGFTERGIRKFAIGRNNWMFSDTPRGADASAQLYSFVITAKMNNINPETALTKIFERVPYARNYEDYKTLAKGAPLSRCFDNPGVSKSFLTLPTIDA
jgi:transposase